MERVDTSEYDQVVRFKRLLFFKFWKRASKDIDLLKLHRTSAHCTEYNGRAVYRGTFLQDFQVLIITTGCILQRSSVK